MKKLTASSLKVFENEEYIVLNKPAGVASLDEHVFSKRSMLRILRDEHPEATLCHRLDKDTSGCLLAAKTPDAYRHASIQFEKRLVQKKYYAISSGSHAFNKLKVELPLVVGNKKVKISHKNGKAAETILSTLEAFKHYSLIECKPITGRLHQIRAHLASQGAPIVNDVLYGGKAPLLSEMKRKFKVSKQEEEQPIIERIALHSFSLEFEDAQKNIISVQAPLSSELEAFLKIIRKYDKVNHD